MNADDLFDISRRGLAELAPRVSALLRSIDDSSVPVPNSTWTVRELAVHLSGCHNYFTEFATGVPSPVVYESKEQFAAFLDAMHADVPETDPGKLAAMFAESIERYLGEVARRSAEQPIAFHNALSVNLAQMTAVLLGEVLLHGYDLATALGEPWSIDPRHAVAVLSGHHTLRGVWVVPSAAGHTARYRLAVRGTDPVTIAFTDGVYSYGPGDVAADCTIDADPVAFLLTSTGRADQWPLIAAGLIGAGGERPDLALRFGSLFVYP